MSKEFTINNIKALDNFKKLSKLGWSVVSTIRQLQNKTIVLDHKLFTDVSTVIFVKFPYVVDGYSESTFNGENLKYTRNQNELISYSSNLSLEQFFTEAFDFIIQTFKHDQKFLINVKDYDKYIKLLEVKPIYVKTHYEEYGFIRKLDTTRYVSSKRSSAEHTLEFPENTNAKLCPKGLTTQVDTKLATTLHISMSKFNYLSRYYDNIIFKKTNIRLNNYEKARFKSGEYEEEYMKTIIKSFVEYENEFRQRINSIKDVVDDHSSIPVNYHKPKIKKPEDLWIIVNDKMKGYKEHLSKIKNYKDYRFFKEIVNILDVKILTDVRAFQAGDQFGFFED